MRNLAYLAFALLLGLTSPTGAAAYADEVLSLEVPLGFEGPVRDSPGPGATVVAYVRRYPTTDRGTVLQITKYDFGAALVGMPENKRGETADFYLNQFLEAVGRRRSSFRATTPERVTLGQIVASRAEWNGIAQGQAMSGVMYCVVVGTVVVSFHTQDFEDAPPENRAAVLKAIQAVAFQ